MTRCAHPSPGPARALLRLFLVGGLALTAAATGAPLARGLLAPPAGAREALVPLPLDGTWTTYANGDRVNRMMLDGGVAWVAAEAGGVVRWDVASGTYRQYLSPQDGLPSNVVRDVTLTPDGVLWAATARGLARLDDGADRFESITPEVSPGMPARSASALAAADDGRLWVGFRQEWDPNRPNEGAGETGAYRPGGLALYNTRDGSWEEEYHAAVEDEWEDPVFETIPSDNVTVLELGSDGTLWVGTEPFFVWDRNTCTGSGCPPEPGFWILAGGGLAGHRGSRWEHWHAGDSASTSCYSNIIRDLAADENGRVWVAASDGLVAMAAGLNRVPCGSHVKYGRAKRNAPGMRGNSVFSVDIDDRGRVWVGHGEGRMKGLGIGVLDHKGTLDDFDEWDSDDQWAFLDLDSAPGASNTIVSAIAIPDDGTVIMGTLDNRSGGGDGLRRYIRGGGAWTVLRTAADGLPSNRITDIERNPATGALWVSTRDRGVARMEGDGWQHWRMFGAGAQVAHTAVDALSGNRAIPVDFASRAAYEAAFPTQPRYVRFGDDPTLYRITSYATSTGAIHVAPDLTRNISRGSPVYSVDRGPASDAATQLAIDASGIVWAGGRETVWVAGCREWPLCWLDGGLGRFDGERWSVYDLKVADTGLPVQDQEVQSVEIDARGRVWAGTGNPSESLDGKGIFVFDAGRDTWSLFGSETVSSRDFGGDGVADMARDPASGDMWVAHHSVTVCNQNSPFGDDCVPQFLGGGVSRWDGSSWQKWTKRSGASIRAAGRDGETRAITVDRGRDRVWVGAYDEGSRNFHWLHGIDVDAVLNWCPLNCENDDWQHEVWPGEGVVADIELDDTGNLWVGINRDGRGEIPPEAGVKVFDDRDWTTYTPENSGLPSNEITVLHRDDDGMWVGTLNHGIAHYSPYVPPTPTPGPTNTPRPWPTWTEEPYEPTPTRRPTGGTPGTPGSGSCGAGGTCSIHLPVAVQRHPCSPHCPTPGGPEATPTPGGSATVTPVGSVTATATAPDTPTSTSTATATPTPTPTRRRAP